jgi:hypothetical protein
VYNVYKFMLKMQGGNPAAFNHLQLEYATIPAADAKRDYLPRLVTFVGAFEHFKAGASQQASQPASQPASRAARSECGPRFVTLYSIVSQTAKE